MENLFQGQASLFAGQTERAQFKSSLDVARRIASIHSLTLDDIATLSPRFWELHCDPMMCTDGATTALLTIQYNLVIGTILGRVGPREDLLGLLNDLLEYKITGQFCLTEVDHGLDAANIETTATALPDNLGFILHTPHLGAAKYMPPTIPSGISCVAVVMARLISGSVDCGVKPFLVPINDGKNMCSGVTARLLPQRGGPSPILHAITSFDQVFLPRGALLDSDISLTESGDSSSRRLDFLMSIWRVAVGSLALSGLAIPVLAKSAYTVALYSRRRLVASGAKTVPIIQFKTQQMPILTAFAQSFVLAEFYKSATRVFTDDDVDFRVRHGIAAAMKVVAMRHTQDATLALSERCSAQGLFNYNQISKYHVEMRGIAIAEGDLLGILIRLAVELTLGRYALPTSSHPTSPLTRHEQGCLAACCEVLTTVLDHRSEAFSRQILPRCQPLVEAIGMRFAYDAAVDAGLDKTITDLYLATCTRRDEVWYTENMGLTQKDIFDAEERALKCVLPMLDDWMECSGVKGYVDAPISSDERWRSFVAGLPVFLPAAHLDKPVGQERSRL
ncbi:acyl-CoA dehydrogenase NM domain-like protein [Mycena sp. CBHHK59/15]|nr:acyl-CoA dehydrogenase NM domain-like protein [Mycena sp. CBHHK59/15]